MRRNSKEDRQPVKARRRKPGTLKQGTPRSRSRSPSAFDLKAKVVRLTGERDEALEQQAAITDILREISNSPHDVQPVLDSVAEHAARICEAHVVDIAIVDNEVFRFAASFGEMGRLSRGESVPLDRSTVTGRSICDLQSVQIADVQNASDEFPLSRELAIKFGYRTTLSVPLIREGHALGAILVRRTEVRPFEDKHVALLKAFADQAAIAIENVRLFEAEQQRTRELTESLEQQTATSEVLQVISSSPGDLQPVFQAMLENAVRICDAKFGNIYQWDGEELHLVATDKTPAAFAEERKRAALRLDNRHPSDPMARMIRTKVLVHATDLATEQAYLERANPGIARAVELGGVRTFLAVPILKESELIGAFALSRQEVQPFTDKQIALVQSFAAQAVIAIENTRLLNELRQRTDDLTESLERQTATSEVLQVISSSPGELEPVFTAMLANATRICEAKFGNFLLREGGTFRAVAWHGEPAYVDNYRREPLIVISDDSRIPLARLTETKQPVHVADLRSEPAYKAGFAPLAMLVDSGGARTLLLVPMLIRSSARSASTVRKFALSQRSRSSC
jgi:GAF domain-containing protein